MLSWAHLTSTLRNVTSTLLLSVQDTPWPRANRTPGMVSEQLLLPSAEPSAKRPRTQLAADALALVPAQPSNAASGDGAAPDIMTFFAQRADRAQSLEATIAALRDANAQLSAQLVERAAEARANRVRLLPPSLYALAYCLHKWVVTLKKHRACMSLAWLCSTATVRFNCTCQGGPERHFSPPDKPVADQQEGQWLQRVPAGTHVG